MFQLDTILLILCQYIYTDNSLPIGKKIKYSQSNLDVDCFNDAVFRYLSNSNNRAFRRAQSSLKAKFTENMVTRYSMQMLLSQWSCSTDKHQY
ncbi:uncharacterized protein V1516DRAFT_669799 [Lipomyces oligophaga]|uniref:uncharacterized protein n=1 Tax=Lipomyces oligophaga TaxID=45792 RepID=UPI0034CE8F65